MHHTLDQLRRGQLAGTKRLNLAADLTRFPEEIFDLADSLEVLDLSHNRLSQLPEDLPRLHRLRVLFLSYNQFETVPEVVGRCRGLSMIGFKGNRIAHLPAEALPPQTRWLILTDNCLEALPDALGSLPGLEKLMLAGNGLRRLPESLARCQNLALLRLAANQLPELPDWLMELPRLAWLAYAGNPDHGQPGGAVDSRSPLPPIPWDQLQLGALLGEGASGQIYQGTWHHPQGPRAVAVKLFKGQITSDGSPRDEMAVCLAAGQHPNLIGPLGEINHHPEAKIGLVLPLLPKDYRALGHPPSLASCSRDTYPEERLFSLEQLLRIATQVAAAATHLHQQGILHGDLYAHNILVHPEGPAQLSDFGAASFYGRTATPQLERLEVLAFGYLLEELLNRCPQGQGQSPQVMADLHRLRWQCTLPQPRQRPNFADALEQLQALATAAGSLSAWAGVA